jgi:hypothetical protein
MKCEPHEAEDCETCEKDRQTAMTEAWAEYSKLTPIERHIQNGYKLYLDSIIESYKHNWHLWESHLEHATMPSIYGSIQAEGGNGDMIAYETFEQD